MADYEDGYWTSRDGLKLHYRDYAPRNGAGGDDRPVVLCLHGLTRNARDFEALARRLSDEWRVISPEMRGRGDSAYAKDSSTYNPFQYVDDVNHLLDEAGIDRYVAIGTSLGGLMTLILAMNAPERIAGAVLNDIGPVIEAEGLARIAGYVGQGRSYPTWMHAARALEELQGDALPHFKAEDWLALAKRLMVLSSNGRIVFDYDMKIAEPFARPAPGVQPDLWPGIENLAGKPVLLLRGARSDVLSAATLEDMAARLPQAEAVTLAEVGHAPTLDEPQAVAAIERLLALHRLILHVLHLHSSFGTGGKELRAAKLINAFGKGAEHTIVSAQPDVLDASAAIDARLAVGYPRDFPPLAGPLRPGRLQRIARAMQGFDLVLTYNWGAMDAVMAHTLFRDLHRLPPLVHHEDGFNEDEAIQRKRSRNWYRRIGLGRTSALVVPSRRLEEIALAEWHQPRGRVVRIANGIDTAAYAKKPRPDVLPRVIKRPGEKWLGTLAGLRPVKNLPRLVRAFAGLPDEWQLVILGEGPEREAIRAEALRLNVAHRVHLPGFVADPSTAVGLFDMFALSSDSEQFPISVVEAMAAGLPVVSTDVGDVSVMLAAGNRPYVAPAGDEGGLAAALAALADNAALRRGIGEENRLLARREYDEKAMVAAYRTVYGGALGRAGFL